MFRDFSIELGLDVYTDTSSAKGIAMRIGLGKIPHLETSQLWLQSKVADGLISIHKIYGKDDVADALTKYLSGPEMSEHLANIPANRNNKVHPQSISIANSAISVPVYASTISCNQISA